MTIYPAVDILDGKVVRLKQGNVRDCTVYSEDPVGFTTRWKDAGAEWLHVVDLRGALTGELHTLEILREITQTTGLHCQFGGGLRSLSQIQQVLSCGVQRVVLGTKAVESLDFLQEAVRVFGAKHIAVGIDAKDGLVAVRGWREVSQQSVQEFAKKVLDCGVTTVVYTDIRRDGMLNGPSFDAIQAMRCHIPTAELIASGGVASLDDIQRLKSTGIVDGVVVGRALFDGIFRLEDALRVAKGDLSL